MYILVGQEAAKISEVKVGGQNKSARATEPRVHRVPDRMSWKFSLHTPTLTLNIFAAS